MNNNNFNYQQPNLYSNGNISPNQATAPTINNEYIPDEQSYIENILRVNKGKKVNIYQSFSDSNEWKDRYQARQKKQALELKRKRLKTDRDIYKELNNYEEVDKINAQIRTLNSAIKEQKELII